MQSFTGGKSGSNGVEIRAGNPKTLVVLGAFISAVIYFAIFMAVVYFVIVIPYGSIQARRGQEVFGTWAGQDVPGLPVRRPATGARPVQVLRHGPGAVAA